LLKEVGSRSLGFCLSDGLCKKVGKTDKQCQKAGKYIERDIFHDVLILKMERKRSDRMPFFG
jgi:hypothetical protein